MDFFSSVFSAPAAEREEEEDEGEQREGEQGPAAAEGEGEGDSGGVWIFGGLIKTLAEEIEEQRAEQEAAAAAAGEEEGDSGGVWIFGGLIKTLAEEIEEQRAEQEAAAAAAGEEEGDSGGGWSFGGLIKTLAEEMEGQRDEQETAAEEGEQDAEAEEGEQDAEAVAAGGEQEAGAAAAEEEEEGDGSGGGWSFGGLMKTFASRPESVLGGYRRDLQDLGSGLRLETTALRAAAARAAAALPGALEAGASAASDRLESVGQAVDDLGAAAAVLLSHANEALRSVDADGEDDDGSSHPSDTASGPSRRAFLPSKKYTRFELRVLALRADPATFTEEPEDVEGFARWRDTFRVDERKEEIEGVLRESPGLESFVERLVPSVVDYETFWCRYFFAVDKLRQAEDVRAKLVSRAMSKEDKEELSWEVDDEDDNNGDRKEGTNTMVDKKEEQIHKLVSHETQGDRKQEAVDEKDEAEGKGTALAATKDDNGESSGEALTPKSSDGTGQEEKTEAGVSSKESDFSVVSRPSVQEEGLSWEEIEDVGDQDEKKGVSPRSSPPSKMEDFRKRLNSVEDDEELSWDVDE